jgi:hypothetical protein
MLTLRIGCHIHFEELEELEACPSLHGPENPLSNLELSKTLEKLLNHDDKHYMFQVSKQKETLKPQIQPQPAKEAP